MLVALIETVRIRRGQTPLWPLHEARLARGCSALGIPRPDPRERPPTGGPDRVWRIEVAAGGVLVGERALGSLATLRLVTARVHHRPYPHKTTERAPFQEASAEAERAGADDALLLTEEGWVAEAGIWSVLWWREEGLAGPPLDLGVLPGVGRARIAACQGNPRPERVPRSALDGLSLLAVNAVRGVVPVATLDGVPVPQDPRTVALGRAFWP